MSKISSVKFIPIFSLVLLALNYVFFKEMFSRSDDLLFIFDSILVFYAICLLIVSVFFIPYLLKPFTVLCLIVGGLCLYFSMSYGTIIDSNMLENAMQTDRKEAFSLLNLNLIFAVLIIIFLIFIIFKIKIIYQKPKFELFFRLVFITLSLVIIGGSFIVYSKTYFSFFRENRELKYYTNPFYPLYSMEKVIKKSLPTKKVPFEQIGLDATLKPSQKPKLFVLVVGETQRAKNYSLNGYTTHDTNEFLEKKDVVSFTNFYSCGTATAVSVPCLFSGLGRSEFDAKRVENRGNLLDVLSKAGVDIFWFDNNSGGCKGVCDRVKKEQTQIYNASDFDKNVFNDASNLIPNLNKTTLIVLHLQGAHGPVYYKEYPSEFKKFTPTCDTSKLGTCSLSQIENTYDNSIRYTDFLLSNLVDSLKKVDNKFDVGMFFASDHGESLGEHDIYLHGMPYAIAPDEQKHIPAIFWLSDKAKLNRLESIKNDKFSHDNIFYFVLGFYGVKSSIYNPNLDIFVM
ncbi:phosphoethanolamine transferase [Campylobacter geochelonis]|uniref:Type III effector HopAH2-2 n=1 Tax=Campylobacter geochelonis TaxID=1780362 RepID=A0A128EJU0_9BACT|nr:phosphoethanolamine--lipid A transferase [Campylobacter geochelonis]QKF71385.1 phosphoethanolamine transferase [Campylobacter geochelonis]CZE48143.1 type III effector HopAH2-2 [Campylobacter geochelonis]CZE49134.1 type III effector HopAH2-2 [Campylobacter geochelonis]CZE51474.1 type III effector HopAH2-2 [Campylobacter geochelonis]